MVTFAEVDPLGGWLQVILQGGALALLSYVVVVLYPKAASESRAEREQRDQHLAAVIAIIQDRFEVRNKQVVDAIKEQTQALQTTFRDAWSKGK